MPNNNAAKRTAHPPRFKLSQFLAKGWTPLDAKRAMRRIEVGNTARQVLELAVVGREIRAKVQCIPFCARTGATTTHMRALASTGSANQACEVAELVALNLSQALKTKEGFS
jgi:hypothetical protein